METLIFKLINNLITPRETDNIIFHIGSYFWTTFCPIISMYPTVSYASSERIRSYVYIRIYTYIRFGWPPLLCIRTVWHPLTSRTYMARVERVEDGKEDQSICTVMQCPFNHLEYRLNEWVFLVLSRLVRNILFALRRVICRWPICKSYWRWPHAERLFKFNLLGYVLVWSSILCVLFCCCSNRIS
jgi:hypothetical protein